MLRKMFKESMKLVEDGQDPAATVRYQHDVINLPCEKNKFGAERVFAGQWINGGSMRYSPIKEQLLDLHVKAWIARDAAAEANA